MMFIVLDINRVAAVVQAVLREDSIIYGAYLQTTGDLSPTNILHTAASDSRKNGIAAGY